MWTAMAAQDSQSFYSSTSSRGSISRNWSTPWRWHDFAAPGERTAVLRMAGRESIGTLHTDAPQDDLLRIDAGRSERAAAEPSRLMGLHGLVRPEGLSVSGRGIPD